MTLREVVRFYLLQGLTEQRWWSTVNKVIEGGHNIKTSELLKQYLLSKWELRK